MDKTNPVSTRLFDVVVDRDDGKSYKLAVDADGLRLLDNANGSVVWDIVK